jgi:hypothetical protein
MTRYSRAVIPGRPNEASSLNAEIENLVGRADSPANDANDDDEVSEDEKIAFVERAASDRRAGANRRKGGRRRVSDFAPLPGEAAHRAADGGSKRGPLLLAGALVVVGVFGVVVWNAYREGVRPEDSAAAPVIEESGAFKSKPAAAETRTAPAPAEATVFEQVEARPNPAPAPEVRPETPPPAAKAAEPPKAEPAAAKPAAAAAKPVETKPAPAPVKPSAAAAKPSAGVVGTTTPAALPVVGGAAKPAQPQAQAAAPAKPAAAPAKPATAPAPAEAPIQLAGAAPAAFTPAFSPTGKFAVQIGAPDSQAGAEAEWAKAARKAPELFGSAERIIVEAQVNGKTVFRLRAGAFATAGDADGFCNAFKAKGGACYRVAK